MITIAVKVKLKKEILDVRGRAILKLLQKESPLAKECRFGKYIEVTLDEKDIKKARKLAEQMAKKILHNDLMESFELEVLPPSSPRPPLVSS